MMPNEGIAAWAAPALVRCALASSLLASACGLADHRAPAAPPMPPLGEVSGEPLGAGHWAGLRGTCTGAQPATLFGLVEGYAFRYEVELLADEGPPRVKVQRDEGTRRTFANLAAFVEGGGTGSRLVVQDGQDLRGEPKVLAWAGADRRFHFPLERCDEERPAAATPAAPAAAEPAPAALVAPAARTPYAAGRPPAWWQARLTGLRRDGPPALYRLALLRAKAAGLSVEEGPGEALTVSVVEAVAP